MRRAFHPALSIAAIAVTIGALGPTTAASAAADCSPLGPATGTTVLVDTTSELQSAVANRAGSGYREPEAVILLSRVNS
jgi:hypothetical protein